MSIYGVRAPTPPAILDQFSCSDSDRQAVLNLVGGDAYTAAYICGGTNVAAVGAAPAVIAWLATRLATVSDAVDQTKYGLNTSFVLQSSYNVFMMQVGFALYAAGVVRAKNLVAILIKSFTDTCIAAIVFYAIGYGFQVGLRDAAGPAPVNAFIGNGDFALSTTSDQARNHPYQLWMWQWSFCAVSTTILSGSIAERATFHSYLIYCVYFTAWVYPVIAHWLWSPNGWLSAYNTNSVLGSGAIDYAGSGVVHTVGGVASFVGALFVGARIGRYDSGLSVHAFRGNSPSLYVMGTFLLWFGWYGFNPGSRLAVDTYVSAAIVARTAVTSTLSAGTGAVTALLLVFMRKGTWDMLATCTGALAGLVAITSGSSVVEPWAAIICGLIAAPCYVYGEVLMDYLRIDDPVSACPLHSLAGIWGLIFTGLLAKEAYVVQVYNKPRGSHLMGIFYGGHGQLLLCQVIAIVVIVVWTAVMMSLLFWFLRWWGILRVPLEDEATGMDFAVCGAPMHEQQTNPRDAKVHVGTGGGGVVGPGAANVAAWAPEVHIGADGGSVVVHPMGRFTPAALLASLNASTDRFTGLPLHPNSSGDHVIEMMGPPPPLSAVSESRSSFSTLNGVPPGSYASGISLASAHARAVLAAAAADRSASRGSNFQFGSVHGGGGGGGGLYGVAGDNAAAAAGVGSNSVNSSSHNQSISTYNPSVASNHGMRMPTPGGSIHGASLNGSGGGSVFNPSFGAGGVPVMVGNGGSGRSGSLYSNYLAQLHPVSATSIPGPGMTTAQHAALHGLAKPLQLTGSMGGGTSGSGMDMTSPRALATNAPLPEGRVRGGSAHGGAFYVPNFPAVAIGGGGVPTTEVQLAPLPTSTSGSAGTAATAAPSVAPAEFRQSFSPRSPAISNDGRGHLQQRQSDSGFNAASGGRRV